MGVISRYRLGSAIEHQLHLQVRRQTLQTHRAYHQPETIAKTAKRIKATHHKEAKHAGNQGLREHIFKARALDKQLKKASGKMSKSQAARVAAMARWGVR